jgi:hypothetical protein
MEPDAFNAASGAFLRSIGRLVEMAAFPFPISIPVAKQLPP